MFVAIKSSETQKESFLKNGYPGEIERRFIELALRKT